MPQRKTPKPRRDWAEATDAANKVTSHAHAQELTRLAAQRKALQNRKLAAEAAQEEAKAGKAGLAVAREKLRLFQEMQAMISEALRSSRSTIAQARSVFASR